MTLRSLGAFLKALERFDRDVELAAPGDVKEPETGDESAAPAPRLDEATLDFTLAAARFSSESS